MRVKELDEYRLFGINRMLILSIFLGIFFEKILVLVKGRCIGFLGLL